MTDEEKDALALAMQPRLEAEIERVSVSGNPLTEAEQAIARHSGVRHPEKIRVCRWNVAEMEAMMQRAFGDLLAAFPLPFAVPPGTTIGYAVMVLDAQRNVPQDVLLAHEFTHTAQVERLGLHGFTRAYIEELQGLGWGPGPLETEANEKMRAWAARVGP